MKMSRLTCAVISILISTWIFSIKHCFGVELGDKERDFQRGSGSQLAPVPGSFRSQSWKNKPHLSLLQVNKTLLNRYFIQQELARRRSSHLKHGYTRGLQFILNREKPVGDRTSLSRGTGATLPKRSQLQVLSTKRNPADGRKVIPGDNRNVEVSKSSFGRGPLPWSQDGRLNRRPYQPWGSVFNSHSRPSTPDGLFVDKTALPGGISLSFSPDQSGDASINFKRAQVSSPPFRPFGRSPIPSGATGNVPVSGRLGRPEQEVLNRGLPGRRRYPDLKRRTLLHPKDPFLKQSPPFFNVSGSIIGRHVYLDVKNDKKSDGFGRQELGRERGNPHLGTVRPADHDRSLLRARPNSFPLPFKPRDRDSGKAALSLSSRFPSFQGDQRKRQSNDESFISSRKTNAGFPVRQFQGNTQLSGTTPKFQIPFPGKRFNPGSRQTSFNPGFSQGVNGAFRGLSLRETGSGYINPSFGTQDRRLPVGRNPFPRQSPNRFSLPGQTNIRGSLSRTFLQDPRSQTDPRFNGHQYPSAQYPTDQRSLTGYPTQNRGVPSRMGSVESRYPSGPSFTDENLQNPRGARVAGSRFSVGSSLNIRRNPFPDPSRQYPTHSRGITGQFPEYPTGDGGLSQWPFSHRGGARDAVALRGELGGFPSRGGLRPLERQEPRGRAPPQFRSTDLRPSWRQPLSQGTFPGERPFPAQQFGSPDLRRNPPPQPVGQSQQLQSNTIFNSLIYNRHNIFLRYLQNVSLIGMLQTGGPYTVFAPSDEAFHREKEKLESLLADKEKRWILISNHIIPGRFFSATFKDGQILTSSIGDKVYVNVAPDPTKNQNNVWIHGAQVSGYDAPASNGVVHRIERVIVPAFETLRDHLKKSNDHTIMAKALANTTQFIPPTLTLLAPLDSAFDYMPKEYKERLLSSKVLMRRLIAYHIIPSPVCRGRIFHRLGLSNTSSLLGPEYSLDLYQDPFLKDTNFINNAGILRDEPVYEGWLLSLSEVLLPDNKLTVDAFAEQLEVSQFVTLLKKSGIAELLKIPYNTYTLFAPSNSAYRSLSYDAKRLLLTNQTYLRLVMHYHYTKVKILSNKVRPVETFDTGLFTLSPPSMGVRIVTNKIHDDFIIQGARVEFADNMAKNGIVHIIDKFLLPPRKSLYDIITTDTRLTYLKRTFQRSAFLPQLRGTNQFTIFAPNDNAFVNLLYYKRNFFRSSRKTFQDFLFQHMCRGVIFTKALKERKPLLLRTLMPNVNQRIERNGPHPEHFQIRKFSSRGTRLDIMASNGIIHVVDRVLIYEYLSKQM